MGKSMDDVEAIVITHAHADHTGFAAALSEETKIPVYIHHDDAPAAAKILQLPWYGLLSNAWRPYIRTMILHAMVNGVFKMPTIRKWVQAKHDDILDVPGRPHVIHLPGHTAGQIALFLPDRNVLISGDSLVTRNLMTGLDGAPQLPHRLLNDDHLRAKASLERLRGLGNLTMMPGHGVAWTGDLDSIIGQQDSA